MQNDWWTALDDRTQRCADMGTQCYAGMGDTRAFCDALKAVSDPHITSKPLYAPQTEVLKEGDKEAILQHWSEHFKGLFNDPCTVQESSLAKIPQADVQLELDDPHIHEEIKKPTTQLTVASHLALLASQQISISMGGTV